MHFDTSTYRVAIAGDALQLQRQPVVLAALVVTEEADHRRGPIGDPQIEVPVKIPVDESRRASVIGVIQPRHGRNRGEPLVTRI